MNLDVRPTRTSDYIRAMRIRAREALLALDAKAPARPDSLRREGEHRTPSLTTNESLTLKRSRLVSAAIP
jgi:hypothetical protein